MLSGNDGLQCDLSCNPFTLLSINVNLRNSLDLSEPWITDY